MEMWTGGSVVSLSKTLNLSYSSGTFPFFLWCYYGILKYGIPKTWKYHGSVIKYKIIYCNYKNKNKHAAISWNSLSLTLSAAHNNQLLCLAPFGPLVGIPPYARSARARLRKADVLNLDFDGSEVALMAPNKTHLAFANVPFLLQLGSKVAADRQP